MSNIEQNGPVYSWLPGGAKQQEDRTWGFGIPIPGGTPTDSNPWGANASQRQRSNWLSWEATGLPGNINYSPVQAQEMAAAQNSSSNIDFAKLLAGLQSGGGGSSTAVADKLARDKFNYEKLKDASEAATALEALQYGRQKEAGITRGFENYYAGGKGNYNKGFDDLLKMITDQGAVSKQGVDDAYTAAMQNVNEGYDAAKGLGDEGYRALNAYLAANPNNPYAGMTAQSGVAPDALTDWLSSYGVSDQPVRGQIAADQLQAGQGAANFQNLINTLSSVASQGAGSRAAEAQMAQNLFNTGLGQEQAGYRSQASNAQAQALAALQQAMFQSRFGVEQDRNTLANQLAQTILAAGGNPNTTVAPQTPQTSQPPLPGGGYSTSYDVNRPLPLNDNPNITKELLDALNARRGR